MADLLKWLQKCDICPNFCRIDRLEGEKGKCRRGAEITVSSADLHFGEEAVLVGRGGSGTIFFTSCNLHCVFCQNYDISQLDYGRTLSSRELVSTMLLLQARGAENINLVSPTHQAPQIFEAVKASRRQGLTLPIVYNCGGYENPEFLESLDGLVDIYMPDFKYGANEAGETYSGIKNYTDYCQKALLEMHRQVGDLALDKRQIAVRGLLIRHLVLPGGAARSKAVIDFIASRLSRNTYLNIMDQYRPLYRASELRELKRRVFHHEVQDTIDYARQKGIRRICSR